MIDSDATLHEAVRILSDSKILSAPIRSVDVADDALWTEKYIGVSIFSCVSPDRAGRRLSIHRQVAD